MSPAVLLLLEEPEVSSKLIEELKRYFLDAEKSGAEVHFTYDDRKYTVKDFELPDDEAIMLQEAKGDFKLIIGALPLAERVRLAAQAVWNRPG